MNNLQEIILTVQLEFITVRGLGGCGDFGGLSSIQNIMKILHNLTKKQTNI